MASAECSTPDCALAQVLIFDILLFGLLFGVFKLVADVLKVLILYLSTLFENVILPQLSPHKVDL